MERIELIPIITSLFLIRFFYFYIIDPKAFYVSFSDWIPFAFVICANLFELHMTDFSLFKLSLSFTFLSQTVVTLIGDKANKNTGLVVSLMAFALLIGLLVLKLSIPVMVINTLLIIASASQLIILVTFYQSKPSRAALEVMEVGFLAFFGGLMLSVGMRFFNIAIGSALLIFYALMSLAIHVKHYKEGLRLVQTRLTDLEERFDRTVEFEAKKRTAHMADKVEIIREKSQKDPLSKALNRQGITTEINSMINDSSMKMFSLAIFDIDFFKGINDTKGHIVGDECIKLLAYTVMTTNRKTDVLGRYGGDEFILLMPNVNAPAALEICERLRKEVHDKSNPKFTISMGIASYPFDGRTFTELMESADKGLYIAKENGRNRVVYQGNVPILKK